MNFYEATNEYEKTVLKRDQESIAHPPTRTRTNTKSITLSIEFQSQELCGMDKQTKASTTRIQP